MVLVLAVNHMPENLASASLSVVFLGASLLPTSGAIEWFLPPRTRFGYSRLSSLIGAGFLLTANAYWVYAALSSLASSVFSIGFIGEGALLTFLGYAAYFFVDVTRPRKRSTF